MEIHSTRLRKKDIYTFEDLTGIAKLADWFVHFNNILKKNVIPKVIFISNYKGYDTIPFFL